ncbi:VOC family protein [Actinoplanes sp. NPDC051633]|uniref:VOC family protein n=1 Tax=Actinoplanes sp. NPDC051633 TaxID=3155670 RepID=UPI0034130702
MTTPNILGISHITLTVRDIAAATDFWTGALGFDLAIEQEAFRFVVRRELPVAILLVGHGSGTFDEHHVGLDHLAFAVPDVESLRQWEQRMKEYGVPYTPIVDGDGGHHLNLRAPDDLPIELYVINETMATAIGLGSTAEAVSRVAY